MKSQFSINGNVTIYDLPPDFTFEDFEKLIDKEKYIVDEGYNLIVTTGLQHILLLMIGATTEYFTECEVGTGTSTPVASDIILGTSLGSNTVNSSYRIGNTVVFNTFFGKNDENGTWTETGIFNDSGVMLCRRLLGTPFVKSTSNSAVISWSINVTATADA